MLACGFRYRLVFYVLIGPGARLSMLRCLDAGGRFCVACVMRGTVIHTSEILSVTDMHCLALLMQTISKSVQCTGLHHFMQMKLFCWLVPQDMPTLEGSQYSCI